tara:strand:- start:30260 stop:31501 length:1242 start_codon:yes stop_codon:yes gene_type:complete
MATSSTIAYCEDRDLQDVYPHIQEYSLKRRLYNFKAESAVANTWDSTLDAYYLPSCGLITKLFYDGNEVQEITYHTNNSLLLDGAITGATLTIPTTAVGGATGVASDDLVKVNNEYMRVATFSSPNMVVGDRGLFGTAANHHIDDSGVILAVDSTSDVQDATSASDAPKYLYDSALDLLIIIGDSDPNDHIMEAGDDWGDIKQRFRRKASRLIESHLDSRMSREVLKDREGNYPAIIVHATALQAVILLLKAHDPTNEVIEPFKSELEEILDGLKSGSIVLPTAVSSDSSKGVIREVSVNSSSDLRPVQLKGSYNAFGYDCIKLKVITGGVVGTSTYSVWVKDSNTLKSNQVVTEEKITGDFDIVTSGLWVRFSGDDVATAITSDNDEYEIEVYSSSMDSDISAIGSVSMTRR